MNLLEVIISALPEAKLGEPRPLPPEATARVLAELEWFNAWSDRFMAARRVLADLEREREAHHAAYHADLHKLAPELAKLDDYRLSEDGRTYQVKLPPGAPEPSAPPKPPAWVGEIIGKDDAS